MNSIKPIFLFFILSWFQHHLFSQFVLNERYFVFGWPSKNLYNLQGPVKSTTTTCYFTTGDSIKASKTTEKGGSYFDEYKYVEFDKNGRILIEGGIFKGAINPSYTYTYNDTKQTLVIAHPAPGYPDQNHKFEVQYFPSKNIVTIAETHPGVPGINKNFTMYYSKDSLILKIEQKNEQNELLMLFQYTHDKKKMVSQDMFVHGDWLMDQHTYSYNQQDQLMRVIWTRNENVVTTKDLGYDQHGNIVYKLTIGYIQPLKESYSYTYDEHGNWITRTLWINSVPEQIDERAIQYY